LAKFLLCAFADEAAAELSGQISAMKENGIGFLEARGIDGVNISDLDKAAARDVKNRLGAEGLRVWSLGSPIGKIKITDDFLPHFDKFKSTLELAHIMSAKNIRLFSFYMPSEETAAFRDTVMERLSAFADYAKGSGVMLCHENEKDIFGDITERCADISHSVSGIRCVFDPANFVQCGVDPLAAWDALEPYVEYVHIKDADANGENIPAGTGLGKIPEIIHRYREIGGQILTLEPHLWSFSGLAALEQGEVQVKNRSTSQREAFDLGVNSLKNILAEI